MSSHMAKSRPAGSSKTERKRDPQETSALKAPPSPTAGPAEDTGAPVEPARSKAEQADSPTPGSASAAMPNATPISGRVPEPAAAPPAQSGSKSESLAELNGSRPPSPTAIAEARPDPKPTAETSPIALAKPSSVIKRAAENGAAPASKGAIEQSKPTPVSNPPPTLVSGQVSEADAATLCPPRRPSNPITQETPFCHHPHAKHPRPPSANPRHQSLGLPRLIPLVSGRPPFIPALSSQAQRKLP